jgi:uncharacterized membrane protein HdeD (DUF308 family)
MPPSDLQPNSEPHLRQLAKFWWVFAVRGGSAMLFGLALAFAGSLLGTIFFDPVVLIFLSLLLGVFVLGNGILLGVAAGFAAEHRLRLGWLLAAECLFAVALGVYIGASLRINPQTLAWLAGLDALGAGAFQLLLALRSRHTPAYLLLLSAAGLLSLTAGATFLAHQTAATHTTAHWLSLFELVIGAMWLTFAYSLHRPARAT